MHERNSRGTLAPLCSMSSDSSGFSKPFVDWSSSTCAGTTKWVELQTLEYVDQSRKRRKWDRAVRTTKKQEVDAVAILANLSGEDDDEIILVKQFRPAIGCYTFF